MNSQINKPTQEQATELTPEQAEELIECSPIVERFADVIFQAQGGMLSTDQAAEACKRIMDREVKYLIELGKANGVDLSFEYDFSI
jgi:hypothetical protein